MQNLQLRIRKSSADSACHLIYCYHRCCRDRKSTRLNSSHTVMSYAVFCLKKKICRVAAVDLMQVFLVVFGMRCVEQTDDALFMRGTDDVGVGNMMHLAAGLVYIVLAFRAD